MKFLRNESLKKHNSFRIGGKADYFCIPKNIEELKQALLFAKEKKLEIAIVGCGTNLLVRDQGFKGLVIKTSKLNAGISLPRLIKSLASKGLGGLEFLAGIPGSVGGAVVMNAGAWGKEISRVVKEVVVLDYNGKEKVFKKKDLKFGYRSSRFQKEKYIIVEVVFRLKKKKKSLIKKDINKYLSMRKSRQPLGSPNCGSIFKNPKSGFAGQIIELAGCKGMRRGDAQVSQKHANFIVNLGEAKARDVIRLMTVIQSRVKVKLEPEIKIW